MAGTYRILGKTVQSHQLAIATLLSVGMAGFALSRGEGKATPKHTGALPPSKGTSGSDEINVEKLLTELIEENDENVN